MTWHAKDDAAEGIFLRLRTKKKALEVDGDREKMVVVKRRRCLIMNNEITVAIVCSLPVALCMWIVGVYSA